MDNVLLFPGLSYNDTLSDEEVPSIPVDEIIDGIRDKNFSELIIIGKDEEGLYFASTSGDPSKVLFDLERARYILMTSYFQGDDE